MAKKKTTQPTEVPPLLQLLGDEAVTNLQPQPQPDAAQRDKTDCESKPAPEQSTNADKATNKSDTPKPPIEDNQAKAPTKSRLTARRAPIKASVELFGQMNREMVSLATYSYERVDLFPKRHKLFVGIGESIISEINECLKLVHVICAYNPKIDKEARLRELSTKLKALEDYVSIAYHQRDIAARNRDAWVRMLTRVDDLAIGTAVWLEKRANQSAARATKATKENGHCQATA